MAATTVEGSSDSSDNDGGKMECSGGAMNKNLKQ